jgi:uncharacterized protein (TIGR02246 family)
MRTSTILCAVVVCAACAKRDTANRPDSTAPAAATVSPGSASGTDVAALRHFIDSAQARYIDAAIKGDAPAATSFYSEDGMVLAPNMKAARGRAEIEKANAQTFAMLKVTALKLSTEDLQASGDLAVETGTYDQTLQPKGGKPIHDVGKYVVVWKKQADGSWKLFREIYNSDLPVPKS